MKIMQGSTYRKLYSIIRRDIDFAHLIKRKHKSQIKIKKHKESDR